MPSRLYTYFFTCWKNETITQEQLQTAVTKGYITQDEYEWIMES